MYLSTPYDTLKPWFLLPHVVKTESQKTCDLKNH